jgi:hypothetical protein
MRARLRSARLVQPSAAEIHRMACKSNLVRTTTGGLLFLLLGSCGRMAEPPPTVSATTTTGAQLTSDGAVIRLGGARCDREVACNHVGSGKKFESRYECVRELGTRTRTELRGVERNCTGGVVETRMDDCLRDVKLAGCDGSIEHVDHFAACRQANLCPAELLSSVRP